MATTVVAENLYFEPERFYSETSLRIMGIDGDALERAAKARELRCTDRGGQRMYKGAWVVAWLEGGETRAR